MNPADAWAYVSGDSCADFFTQMLQGCRFDVPANGAVMEIGCAELDWLSIARRSWPDMAVTGIDVRGHKKPPAGATVITGDVLTHDFPESSFDWIVSVSALEHVGLGHYGDPKQSDGDSVALQRAWRWLKPGGWLTFDVPWNVGADAYEVVGTSHRVYDDATVDSRLRQGLDWVEAWTGCANAGQPGVLVEQPERLKGGERFYYRGFVWQKPHG